MNNNDYLNVWHEKELVGKLWSNIEGAMGFQYENSWQQKGFPISQQLPLNSREFAPKLVKAHRFFANLLPEAGARLHIVKDLKVPNSDYELLKALGGECAGALSILPFDCGPSDNFSYTKLSSEELQRLLIRKGHVSFDNSSEERPRLLLAGIQDKCAVFFNGNDFFLPQYDAPSTHILKFEINDYKNIPAYEYFLCHLAKSVGLPVVDTQLRKYDHHYYLLIKRYDRIIDNKKVQRLHQEDFCQALGFGYENKYQQHGGPSFTDCFRLLKAVSAYPIRDTYNLLSWQIFNVLAGNSDGHAKNFALIYNTNNTVELAPFYDLVCTRAVDRIDTKLALSVGSEFEPYGITLSNWEELAVSCNIRKSFLIKAIQEMLNGILENLPKVYDAFEYEFREYPALQRVKSVITKQCKKVSFYLS